MEPTIQVILAEIMKTPKAMEDQVYITLPSILDENIRRALGHMFNK
jgi:hypothetical protein